MFSCIGYTLLPSGEFDTPEYFKDIFNRTRKVVMRALVFVLQILNTYGSPGNNRWVAQPTSRLPLAFTLRVNKQNGGRTWNN